MYTGEEDLENLKLGKDFANANSLSIAEITQLLQHKKEYLTQFHNGKINPVFEKTFDYVKRFNQFSKREEVLQIRPILEGFNKLTEFECASLWNLCPEHVDEAKTLIPSLKRLDNDTELQTLLDELAGYRTNKAQILYNK